jgi:chemotaxis receptor (MCP) glutamine deamidase CheD/DNA-binding NarL/FixJ family response regulator
MDNRKIKVMIVDDQALVLDILAKGLARDPGIEIVGTATDGQLALNQVYRLKPDVIILDLEMPRMNGIQFLHNLMPENPIPTIVLSALTQNDSRVTQEAFEAGAVDFLAKPSAGAHALSGLLNQLWTKIKIVATQDVKYLKKEVKPITLPTNELDRKAKTNKIILGMGAFEISDAPGKELKIYALGSCVGVALFCPNKSVVGLGHIVLPSSSADREKAEKLPGYFADSGVRAMLSKMNSHGCVNSTIIAKIAGGAKTGVDIGDYFGIGQRNSVAVKATLIKNGVKVVSSELGGNISRTATVNVGNQSLFLYHPDRGTWEI